MRVLLSGAPAAGGSTLMGASCDTVAATRANIPVAGLDDDIPVAVRMVYLLLW